MVIPNLKSMMMCIDFEIKNNTYTSHLFSLVQIEDWKQSRKCTDAKNTDFTHHSLQCRRNKATIHWDVGTTDTCLDNTKIYKKGHINLDKTTIMRRKHCKYYSLDVMSKNHRVIKS